MITQTLGDQIDIHGGGYDLIYPHHESERAQSESATGKKPFVSYWTHVAMVEYENEKMSKSLGNLVHVSDLLKNYSADSIRYVLLSHHYRTPWEFQFDELKEAENEISKIRKAQQLLPDHAEKKRGQVSEGILLLDEDMQTPETLMRLCELSDHFLRSKPSSHTDETLEFLDLLAILGYNKLS